VDNSTHTPVRKIIHIDMDAFYASVEQRDDETLRGKPIIVGGSPTGRGVVATASYEARKFGIHSAMSARRAAQLCPQAIFVRPRFPVYKEASNKIREIFHRYTDLVEPLSLDEAYLDVTEDKLNIGSAIEIAKQIKQSIKDELQLTASAGVSINKFVAKTASGLNKPDGLTFIGPSAITTFMEKLAVEKFHGVGKVTAAKMKNMGLHTGADLKRLTEEDLVSRFGKTGRFYYKIVRGIDDRPVQPYRETKSVSSEDTFREDTNDLTILFAELDKIATYVYERLQRYQLKGRTITVKIKFEDFKIITRSLSPVDPVGDDTHIATIAKQLLAAADIGERKVRLLGIGVSNFDEGNAAPNERGHVEQLTLF